MITDRTCLLMCLAGNCWNDSVTTPSCTGDVYHTSLLATVEDFREICDKAIECGFDSLLLDIANGIKFKTHPEIGVEGAWTPEFMTEEVRRLRAMGFNVYPKLNFSAAHDAWLGIYGRMLGTKDYYAVVKDLIYEVCDMFETPELFHIGMNEECEASQKTLTYACYRQFDALMHDVNFILQCVRDKGVRPWMWGDIAAKDFDSFCENVGKDVLVSPYYFNHMFSDAQAPLIDTPEHVNMRDSYKKLTESGYEILPCGTNHVHNGYSFEHNVRFTKENAIEEKVAGFMITSWRSTTERNKYRIFAALQHVKEVKEKFLD